MCVNVCNHPFSCSDGHFTWRVGPSGLGSLLAFPMVGCCSDSQLQGTEEGKHFVSALSQALPSTEMVLVLSGLLTSRHRSLWVTTGHSPPSRSGMVCVSLNGFTRLASCFIILLYYKHGIKY